MRVLAIGVVVCFVLCWGAIGLAGETTDISKNTDIAMHYDQQAVLQEMLTKIKPAAGVEEIDRGMVEKPTKLPYWKQKVMRRRRGSVSE